MIKEAQYIQVDNSEEAILGPYNYLSSKPGKDVRKQFTLALNKWLKVSEEDLNAINNVITMLHTSSLLIDDIEDDSDLQRGFPAAHKIYGIPTTINTANYVYCLTLQKILEINNPQLVVVFADELVNLHWGQGIEIYWRENLICPSEQDYKKMASNKTGGLFRLAVRMMQACSTEELNVLKLVDMLGIYFQIRDDYLNINNKGFFEDITEGKFSFPIMHAIRTGKYKDQIISIMRQKTRDENMKQYAADLILKSGSFDYTLEYLKKIETDIYNEIKVLGGNERLSAIMAALSKEIKL
ncbi:hypothetical protein BB558_007068 [Smittium angustum]|uniref:Geranylgeranyl pyrophosphate synthase n=1 Tax=Smittium angustum TaxID=133377 RepID=A0A2U1IW14_SMIAN|nr:hypothetical protein BB558_007068 [Smittium angustum]